MYIIDKSFNFCYGHRVWSQKLEGDFCENGDTCAKCRHLHGHEGLVKVFLSCDNLTNGMVTDFKHLGWLKTFIDTYIDHKFIVDINDPMFGYYIKDLPTMFNMVHDDFVDVFVPGTDHVSGKIINPKILDDSPISEILGGYFLVDFVPTSENLSKWLFDCVDVKMKKMDNVLVDCIEWWETPKSRSRYYRR